MITKRDIEIFKFINRYGKTYNDVLAKTFFNSSITSSKRVNELKKQGLLTFWNTNLMSPRRAILLTNEAKQFLENEHQIKPKNTKLNMTTIRHNMIEQVADFWLQTIGEVERTTVSTHTKVLHHIPDFIFTSQKNQRFNIEVEVTKKTVDRYQKILLDCSKDDVDGILYIFKIKDDIKRYIDYLPRDNRLLFIDIDSLVFNIKTKGKIEPISQAQNLFDTK